MIAHIQEKTGRGQPLKDHLLNTAGIAKMIGSPLNLGCLSFFTAYFHDLGKARKKFQEYLEAAVLHTGGVLRGSVNHSSAGGIYLYNRYYNKNRGRMLTAQLMSEAVFSHHGLTDCLGADGTPAFYNRLTGKEELDYEEVMKNRVDLLMPEEELDPLFDKAVKEVEELEEKVLRFVQALSEQLRLGRDEIIICRTYFMAVHERLLLSIVIDADRLDTAAFCGSREEEGIADTTKADDIWTLPLEHLEKYLLRFQGTDQIAELRKQISSECREASAGEGGIYRLSVPTGGGKTLASVRYAVHHARKHGRKRIIYTAPFLSILEQNAQVFRSALGEDILILEHHSNILEDEADEEKGTGKSYKYLTENWDAPFIATTSVQFLNTLFSDSTQSIRRFHNLSDAVIIVDEIQALPLPMIDNFNMMLNYLHYIMGSTIVLCTATQPSIEKVEFPVLLHKDRDIVKEYGSLYKKLKRVEIIRLKENMDSTKLRQFIAELMCSQNHLLIILNTNTAVKKVYEELQSYYEESGEEIRLIHLSTNMCAEHRLSLIEEIKNTPAADKLICVSSSLIEAGVDLSCDCVIRSYAGLDSIAQAAGRCNRNGEIKERLGKVYLIHLEEEYLGKLKHIRRGALCSEDITADYEKNPQMYDFDLLSPVSMGIFYKNYYQGEEQKRQMRYPIKGTGRNMLGLLSRNMEGIEAFGSRFEKKLPEQQLFQAFKYAGKHFRAIESDTIPVLVPYGRGEKIIAELNGKIEEARLKQQLRAAQRFTVNLYRHQIDQLAKAGALSSLDDRNVTVLKGGFYNEDTGVTAEGTMSFLSVD